MSEYVEHAVWDLTNTEITVEVIVLFILLILYTPVKIIQNRSNFYPQTLNFWSGITPIYVKIFFE
jgi:hypothetical protein